MNEALKMKCEDCDWRGLWSQMLTAPNPFIENDTLYACPGCRDVGTVTTACDEPECWKDATCGTPVPDGYRHTCYQHIPPSTPKQGEGE